MLSKTKKKSKKIVALKATKKRAAKKVALKATKKKAAKKVALKATKNIPTKGLPPDKAHSPGHRKMKFADTGEATITKMRIHDSALNTPTRAELDKRKNTKTRRIISGAAVDKTGRITIKE